MKTKVLLSALCLPAIFAACTNEDFMENAIVNDDAVLANREVVDLNIVTGNADTKMDFDGTEFVWEEGDKLGSFLVDPTTQWSVADAHIGNNRWDFNGTGFTTQGTTVEGMWMFYYPYQEAMSSSRKNLTVTKSIINQEYDADGKKMAANDFRISPVYAVNAAEGGQSNIEVEMNSVYAYGVIDATFAQDVTVDKVLIKAATAIFNDKLEISATKAAATATMNYAKTKVGTKYVPVTLAGGATPIWADATAKDENKVPSISKAIAELQDWGLTDAYAQEGVSSLAPGTATTDAATTTDYILIDCGEGVATASKKFSTYVLLPAGEITAAFKVYFYTNKGVYYYDVKPADYAQSKLYFKRGAKVQLHNVNKLAELTGPVIAPTTMTIAEATNKVTDGSAPIVETSDLVNLINSQTTTGALPVADKLLGTVEFNDAVAAALEANTKVTSLTVGDINVTCGTQNISKLIANKAVLKSGANVTFKGGQIKTLEVEAGATATIAANIGDQEGATALVKGTMTIADGVSYTKAPISLQGGNLYIGAAAATRSTTAPKGVTALLLNIESGLFEINVPLTIGNSSSAPTLGLEKKASGTQNPALTVNVNAEVNGTRSSAGAWTGFSAAMQPNIEGMATVNVNANFPVAVNKGTIISNDTLNVVTNSGTITSNLYANVTTNNGTIKNNAEGAKLYVATNGSTENNANANIETVAKSQTWVTVTNNGSVFYVAGALISSETNTGVKNTGNKNLRYGHVVLKTDAASDAALKAIFEKSRYSKVILTASTFDITATALTGTGSVQIEGLKFVEAEAGITFNVPAGKKTIFWNCPVQCKGNTTIQGAGVAQFADYSYLKGVTTAELTVDGTTLEFDTTSEAPSTTSWKAVNNFGKINNTLTAGI